jgi:uroporphyrinogen III methyltransferase/synthase
MGMKNLARVCSNLMKAGMPAETPAAVVHRATHPDQRVVTGTVKTIPGIVKEAGIGPPSLLIIGGVVSLRDTLAWREKRPLAGKTIVVTRARTQASRFAALLAEYGARVVELPTIEFEPPESFELADRAIEELESYDWVVFTSPNGVVRFVERLLENGRDLRAFGRTRIATIGPETGKKVRALHLDPDLVPDSYVAEGLVDAFEGRAVEDQRILIPRAQEARETLPEELRKLGAEVHVAPVYRTVRPVPDEAAITAFREKRVDMVTFTASSTVTNFMAFFEEGGREVLEGVKTASIGPITSEKARSFGLAVDVEPGEYTIPALADAIVEFYRKSG